MLYDEFYIGNKIKMYRKKLGVSARQMSIDLGYNAAYIATLEAHISYPSFPKLQKIVEYLGITIPDFFTETNTENSDTITSITNSLKDLNEKQLSYILEEIKKLNN